LAEFVADQDAPGDILFTEKLGDFEQSAGQPSLDGQKAVGSDRSAGSRRRAASTATR
jgi:hypothetical protein